MQTSAVLGSTSRPSGQLATHETYYLVYKFAFFQVWSTYGPSWACYGLFNRQSARVHADACLCDQWSRMASAQSVELASLHLTGELVLLRQKRNLLLFVRQCGGESVPWMYRCSDRRAASTKGNRLERCFKHGEREALLASCN